MNTSPTLRQPHSLRDHGRNRERYFWQSRAGTRDAPHLTDLAALALTVRRTWKPRPSGA